MRSNDIFIGIDIGTTNCKGIAIDSEGKLLASVTDENTVLYPKHGWAEQNPEEHWWKKFIKLIHSLLKTKSFNSSDIKCIGITGLGPNLILLDKNGYCVRDAILYADTRSVQEINSLTSELGDIIFESSGNTVTTQTVVPKLVWTMKNELPNFKKTSKILIGSYNYVVFKLTGASSIDYGTAKWTGLFDGKNLQWRDDICNSIGLPSDLLPSVCHASDIVGEVSRDIANEIGIPPNTPVITGALDSGTSALSAGIVDIGDTTLIYGTTALLKVLVPDFKKDPRLHSDIHCIKPLKYFLGGAMTTTGAIVRWFRDNLAGGNNYAVLDEEASKISTSNLLVLPYFMGERTPIFDALARGVIFGLTLKHTKYHIYRAILEAKGYAIRQHLEILKENGVEVTKVMVSGGGAKSKAWKQIISDITGLEQFFGRTPGASFGVAYLAGYGVNNFKDFNMSRWIEDVETTKPRKDLTKRYKQSYEIYIKLYQQLKDVFEEFHYASKVLEK